MKILIYVPQPNLRLDSMSGYGAYLRELINSFEKAGHEVVPFFTGEQFAPPATGSGANSGEGLKRVAKRLIPKYIWRSLREFSLMRLDRGYERVLEQTVRQVQPDIIFERAAPLQRSGTRVAQRLGVPRILQMDAPFIHEVRFLRGAGSWFSGEAEKVEREQMATAYRVNVVSATIRDYFVEHHGLHAEKFFVTHNGIDPAKLQVDGRRVKEIAREYDLEGKLVIGFVGSFFRWHGIDLLIRGARQLHADFPQMRFLIVGDGEIGPELRALAQEEGTTNYVHFTGIVPHADVFNHIEVMDVGVMPSSNWYGSPIKIFEYGAMGKAIVAPATGPVREVMQDGEDGLLIPPDVTRLVMAIRRLAEDAAARARMAQSFQYKVLHEHTWPRIAAQMLAVMSNAVVSNKRQP